MRVKRAEESSRTVMLKSILKKMSTGYIPPPRPIPPEGQRIRRDALLWAMLDENGQKKHGGTFTEFRKRLQLMTPDDLYQHYKLLTPHERYEFLHQAAMIETADSVDVFLGGLPSAQREEHLRREVHFLYSVLLPTMMVDAIDILHKTPDIEFDALLDQIRHKDREFHGVSFDSIEALTERRLKTARDRKSKPETIRRNVEICDLRLKDAKTWTQGKLAKKYKLTPQGIRKILAEDTKWRQLAASLEH